MGVIAKYRKEPTETKRYQIEYSNWLDTGEQVSTVTFAVTPVTSSPLVISNVQNLPDGTGVQYYASGGLNGTDYTVTATLTTNASPTPQVKNDEIVFSVRTP